MSAIGILGAGSWGTALAVMLGRKGLPVRLWGRDPELIARMKRDRINARYLPETIIPDCVEFCEESDMLAGIGIGILAVPAGAVREVLDILPSWAESTLWVLAAKGLEPEKGELLSQVLMARFPRVVDRYVVLSGPNLAVELVRGIPTATVAASRDAEVASLVQELFMSPTLRVYTNPDVIGVELGGALKNVYAIGAGISDGLGYGDNTKGVLLTRGLAEMMRLGTAMGANPETFTGLTGVGDLFATAASRLSRNYRFGYALAQGKSPGEALQELGQVVEGYPTALVACTVAHEREVDAPILNAISNLLLGKIGISEALQSLMNRPPKGEREFQFIPHTSGG
jgi:glycerol-3-phosphate dehydrogenase (NAD(P)+)